MHAVDRVQPGQPSVAPQGSGPLPDFVAVVARWQRAYQRLRTRRALLRLTDEQLADVGLTRAAANQEALRPFWRL